MLLLACILNPREKLVERIPVLAKLQTRSLYSDKTIAKPDPNSPIGVINSTNPSRSGSDPPPHPQPPRHFFSSSS